MNGSVIKDAYYYTFWGTALSVYLTLQLVQVVILLKILSRVSR